MTCAGHCRTPPKDLWIYISLRKLTNFVLIFCSFCCLKLLLPIFKSHISDFLLVEHICFLPQSRNLVFLLLANPLFVNICPRLCTCAECFPVRLGTSMGLTTESRPLKGGALKKAELVDNEVTCGLW